MQKKRYWQPGRPCCHGKINPIRRVLRLTFFLLTAALIHVPAANFAQSITLKNQSLTLKQIFAAVEKQTAYVFLYTEQKIQFAPRVTVSADKVPLEKFLEDVFASLPQLQYKIRGKSIFISEKAMPSNRPADSVRFHVVDSAGVPLLGASIVNKSTGKAGVTDAEGILSLAVSGNDIVIISYVGFASQSVTVTRPILSNSVLSIILKPAASTLDGIEVMVNTGYQQLPRERATGSFFQIDNQLLNRKTGANILDRLEDVTSGLDVDRRGNGVNFDLRGRSTIMANDQPLIVLDNFPYEGDLANINPNDVESVTILKDAAAASIWGVRAGNGVIVITTRKGKLNQPVQIGFNTNVTIGEKPSVTSLPWISSADYIELEKELFNKGFYNADEMAQNRPPLTPAVELMIEHRDGLIDAATLKKELEVLKNYDIRQDMQDHLYRSSIHQQHAINVRGGGNRHSFLVSAGLDNNLSNVVNDDGRRITLRADNTFKPFNNLEFQVGVIYTQSRNRSNGLGYSQITNGTNKAVYPYARLVDDQGTPASLLRDYRAAFIEGTQQLGYLPWNYNPIEEINARNNKNRLGDIRINTGINYNFLGAFQAQLSYVYQQSDRHIEDRRSEALFSTRDLINRYTQLNTGIPDRPIPRGSIVDRINSGVTYHALRAQLNFDRSWLKHRVTALAGFERRESQTEGFSNRVYGYNEDVLTFGQQIDYNTQYRLYPTNALLRIPYFGGTDELFDAAISYYSNVSYAFDGRLVWSGSARIDQSNLFGVNTNQKSVPLWSTGLSWVMSKESFYHIRWLPYLKLRGTFGYNGNVDKSVTAYTTVQYLSNASVTRLPYAILSSPPNPELRWEKVGVLNLGIDFRFIENRLSGSFEYYIKNGKDLLGFAPVDRTTGVESFRGNVANIRTRGVDMVLNSVNSKGKLGWTTNLLLSWVKGKVTRYAQAQTGASDFLGDESINRNSYFISPIEGKPVFGIYSYYWAGLDHETGDPMGFGQDGHISNDYASIARNAKVDDLQYHGPARPTLYGSLRNTFSYKEFSLSANIAYKGGHYFIRPSISYNQLFTRWNGHSDFADRWQHPGDELKTNVPSIVYPANTARDQFYNSSAAVIEPADHIRLQDISFSFTPGFRFLQHAAIKNAQIYLYAANLGMLWRKNNKGVDPEFPQLAIPRSYSLGLKFNL